MPAERPESGRSLLSASTIVILSAFLVGVAVGEVGGPDFSPFVLMCGLCGFVTFIGLRLSSRRRRSEALEQEIRQVENRLDRHVKPAGGVGFVLPHGFPKSRGTAAT